jgi:hypothetical protein
MFYHQNKAFKLMEEYAAKHARSFDIVLVFRADINAEPPPNRFPIVDTVKANTVYIPHSGEPFSPGINSRAKRHVNDYDGITTVAAYGNSDSMRKYCSLIEKKDSIINHPEVMLLTHLNSCGLNIERFTHNIKMNPERYDKKYGIHEPQIHEGS